MKKDKTSSRLRHMFLHGASWVERLEVARRLHDHSPCADGAFVEARLTSVPGGLRAERLFDAPDTNWVDQARGGTLLVDELDCLSPALQRRFVELLRCQSLEACVIVASRYDHDMLLQHGLLEDGLRDWLQSLKANQCLGPERIRAVRMLPGEKGSPGLAGIFEPVMRGYVTAGLEAGDQNLHAQVVGAVERPLISMVLHHTGGNQLRAAELLGVNRNTLRKRIRDFEITVPKGET